MAKLTAGKPWPDGSESAKPGYVIHLQAEDGLADTVGPRLALLGAASDRIWHVDAVADALGSEQQFSIDTDLAKLESMLAAAKRTEQSVDLIVIDPLTAYLGPRVDYFKDPSVRHVLSKVKVLAEKHRVAAVAVMHLNKAEQQSAIYRTGGSVAFMAAARAAILVTTHPKDDTRRLFLPFKWNLGPKPPGRALDTEEQGIRWDPEPVNTTADEVLGGKPGTPREAVRLREAVTFLRAELADGPCPVDDIKRKARTRCYKWRTVERAKDELYVETYREGGRWLWALPEGSCQ
jgi:hypothetical protein